MANKTNTEINGNKYYRVTRTVGHKANGIPIRKSFYGKGINEANEKADQYINDIKNGLSSNYSTYTVGDLMHSWLFDFMLNSSSIKPSTFERYEGIYRKYVKNSSIEGEKLSKINSIILQHYFNELSKKYKYSQMNVLRSTLKTFFNWCIDNGYLIKNPCKNIELKGNKSEIMAKKKQSVETISLDELNVLKSKLKGSKYELLILMDFCTGLRRGELLALDYSKIDFDKKELKVDVTVKEVYVFSDENVKKRKSIFQSPKTSNSYRTVPIPDKILNMLDKNGKGLLFHDEEGNPLKGKDVSTYWTKLLKECNIPHKKFHAIRHTYASNLLKNGVDIQTVAELLGHSAITITQIYLHSDNETKREAINKLTLI